MVSEFFSNIIQGNWGQVLQSNNLVVWFVDLLSLLGLFGLFGLSGLSRLSGLSGLFGPSEIGFTSHGVNLFSLFA
jgi:hypothetical protein